MPGKRQKNKQGRKSAVMLHRVLGRQKISGQIFSRSFPLSPELTMSQTLADGQQGDSVLGLGC